MDKKTKVKRVPKRGHYDQETIFNILDKAFLCHVGFIHEGYPVVIPTLYGRKDDILFLHGSAASRMMKDLANGIDVSICVSLVNGLVLARSAFHHSMNYESVVLFGKAEMVEDPEAKMAGLKVVSDQVLKGRWEEVRLPNEKEMKATTLLQIQIKEASAKIRTGPPGDDKEDYELDIWAGVVPVKHKFLPAEVDPLLKAGINLPDSVKNLFNE
ncbi:MAG: pyridoxamine 5'-phosphate oxidase family protein [Saprospiraceae bacterium]|nr:pyridoxamine 5'-phosphate oxidase family protein [Saprospiraceae bacterium]